MGEVERMREAVLASWTLTYQRESQYQRELERAELRWKKKLVRFSRYRVAEKEITVTFNGRGYVVEVPAPEPVSWVPFTDLMDRFEAAVRADCRHGRCWEANRFYLRWLQWEEQQERAAGQ